MRLLKNRVLTGGPRISSVGEIISWFGLMVDTRSLALFLDGGRQNIIGELETLTVAMSLLIWGDIVSSSQLMIYIYISTMKVQNSPSYEDTQTHLRSPPYVRSLQRLLINSSYFHGSVEFHPVQILQISLPEMFHTDSSETPLVFRKRKLRKSLRRASNLSVKPDSQPPKHGWGPWRTKGYGHLW